VALQALNPECGFGNGECGICKKAFGLDQFDPGISGAIQLKKIK
jgi:hypothetical protein